MFLLTDRGALCPRFPSVENVNRSFLVSPGKFLQKEPCHICFCFIVWIYCEYRAFNLFISEHCRHCEYFSSFLFGFFLFRCFFGFYKVNHARSNFNVNYSRVPRECFKPVSEFFSFGKFLFWIFQFFSCVLIVRSVPPAEAADMFN